MKEIRLMIIMGFLLLAHFVTTFTYSTNTIPHTESSYHVDSNNAHVYLPTTGVHSFNFVLVGLLILLLGFLMLIISKKITILNKRRKKYEKKN